MGPNWIIGNSSAHLCQAAFPFKDKKQKRNWTGPKVKTKQ